ncbi:hypothetical protein J6Q66_08360 [bacterium]|nr:hypothetical protein [bacterium]
MIIKKKKQIQEKPVIDKVEEQVLEPQEEFDFSSINFEEREERRKGNRRRGYRRIDDRNLVSRAQEEAYSIKENAVKDGYQEGLAQAQEEIAMIRNAISEFFQYKEKMLEIVSKDVMDISLEIAQKIIKKEAQVDKSILLNLITEIFDKNVGRESRITIRAGSEDVDFLKSMSEEITQMTGSNAKINIVEDKQIVGGGVIIETTNGIVDASFKTQFEFLKEALKKI